MIVRLNSDYSYSFLYLYNAGNLNYLGLRDDLLKPVLSVRLTCPKIEH